MLLEQTLSKMRTLRLATMARTLEERINRGDHRDLPAEEFIGLLIDDEYSARQNRRLSRMIGKANFKPEHACLENIKYDPKRGFQKKDIMQFTTPRWLENRQNVVFNGATGTGKTYLAEALGLQACKMGYTAQKISYKRLFDEIRQSKGTGLYLKYLEKLNKINALIIDDFLMHPIDQDDLSELMAIIEDRSQQASTIITTQYPPAKWHGLLPDPTIADAICDRIKHGAIIIKLEGESMRKSNEKLD